MSPAGADRPVGKTASGPLRGGQLRAATGRRRSFRPENSPRIVRPAAIRGFRGSPDDEQATSHKGESDVNHSRKSDSAPAGAPPQSGGSLSHPGRRPGRHGHDAS
jgi:hypothetical protein